MSRWWLALFILAPLAASAADPGDVDQQTGRRIQYKARDEVTFEGVELKGELVGPSATEINERPKLVFPSLYHPRDQFYDAMKSAVDEVK